MNEIFMQMRRPSVLSQRASRVAVSVGEWWWLVAAQRVTRNTDARSIYRSCTFMKVKSDIANGSKVFKISKKS
jgi:hypothetical protein